MPLRVDRHRHQVGVAEPPAELRRAIDRARAPVARSPLNRATVASTMSRNPCPTPSGTSSACRCAFISQPAPDGRVPSDEVVDAEARRHRGRVLGVSRRLGGRVRALACGDRFVHLREPPCGVREGLELRRAQLRWVAIAEGRVGLGPRLRARGVAGVGDAVDARLPRPFPRPGRCAGRSLGASQISGSSGEVDLEPDLRRSARRSTPQRDDNLSTSSSPQPPSSDRAGSLRGSKPGPRSRTDTRRMVGSTVTESSIGSSEE